MKAIVTGGAGFIGSHIAGRLMNDGNDVTVIDNFHTGNIANLKRYKKKFKLIKGDASRISKLPPAETVFHAGIYSSTPMYRADPTLVGKAISDFMAVLEYTRKNSARLVFASTSSIYNGYPPPHKEEMTPYVKDFYTEARYPMERLADLYNQMFGVSYIGLRYFSVYGDGEESKKEFANMVSQIIWKGLLDKPIRIYGDGSQKRDLVNVDDVVDANMLCAKNRIDGIFNIGNGKSYSFNEMISMVGKHLGKEIKVDKVPNPLKNYVDIVEADTTKMKSTLGFAPKVTLDDGVGRAIEYYKALKKVPNIQ